MRRSKREAADLSSQEENRLQGKSNFSESEVTGHVNQSRNSKNDVNLGEKRKLLEDDDNVTDDEDEELVAVLKKRISQKRKKPWVSLENSDDDMQDVDKKCSKRSPDGLHHPSPKRIAVSDTDEEVKMNGKEPS